MQAVVIGATGACGKPLVSCLLQSKDTVGKVTLLSRRRLEELPGVDVAAEESAGRLSQHIEDLDSVSDDTVRQLCTGAHVFFNTLGTTRRAAGSAAAFRHIDMEIPERMSRLAQEAGVRHCSVLTSTGSNPNSWFLYLRTKGELENAVRGMGFSRVSVFRPGGLNRGASMRTIEKLAALVFYMLPVEKVGQAMAEDAIVYHSSSGEQQAAEKEMIANNTAIRQLAQQYQQKMASPATDTATAATDTPPQPAAQEGATDTQSQPAAQEETTEAPPQPAAQEETTEAPPQPAAQEETTETPPQPAAQEETTETPPQPAAEEETTESAPQPETREETTETPPQTEAQEETGKD